MRKQTLAGLQEHVPLSSMTTMRVGGPARYFYIARNHKALERAFSFAREHRIPVFVLGGGSNVVVSDEGFPGLVVRPDIKGVQVQENGVMLRATVGAGEDWDAFVARITDKKIFSIENLSAIPGTVGAAPIQNIGAYGVEVQEFISRVEVFDAHTFQIRTLSSKECLFGYRDSIFKKPEGKNYVITRMVFEFPRRRAICAEYKDIREFIVRNNLNPETLSPKNVRDIIIKIRSRKFPDLRTIGTAGSFFKNPILPKEKFLALAHIYRGLPGYPINKEMVKVPLGWIIEHVCGKKGFSSGPVSMHDKQALVLVHRGGGRARDIKKLADEMRSDIKRQTGIDTEFEVSFVGKF